MINADEFKMYLDLIDEQAERAWSADLVESGKARRSLPAKFTCWRSSCTEPEGGTGRRGEEEAGSVHGKGKEDQGEEKVVESGQPEAEG